MGIAPRWDVRIPMRDGVELSASLYLPPGATEPGPALFALTPYTVQRNHHRASFFAGHGYAFLVVDVRGRGNSEGTFRPFLRDAEDAYDLVEWIARQPFCNGKVAMFSGSYEGFAQWAAAKEFPPHLVSIAPSASAAPGIEFPTRKNRPSPYLMQWIGFVSGRTSQDNLYLDQQMWRDEFRRWFESGRSFRELDEMVGIPSPIFQEWLDHPVDDDYWRATRPTADEFARIDLPILTLTGSYDTTQLGALYYYREHRARASAEAAARHYLVIGPWDHFGILAPRPEASGVPVGEAGRLDVLGLIREWYDWTISGGPRPPFLERRVAYYVTGADRWRYADELDDATSRTDSLHLGSTRNPDDVFHSGALTAHVAGGGPDDYVHDPRDTALAALESTVDGGSAVDDRMVHAARGRRLVYHGAPFADDVEITGFFRLVAWLAIDQPDTDFQASVYEVRLDGSSILLSSDSLRARYRRDAVEEQLVATTDPLPYDFDRFTFISRRVERGSRLRLVVGPVHSIFSQKNYNSGGVVSDESVADARVVTVRLFHDEAHQSVLHVPIGRPEG